MIARETFFTGMNKTSIHLSCTRKIGRSANLTIKRKAIKKSFNLFWKFSMKFFEFQCYGVF